MFYLSLSPVLELAGVFSCEQVLEISLTMAKDLQKWLTFRRILALVFVPVITSTLF